MVAVAATVAAQNAPNLVPVPEFELSLQRGFRISLYADADLAPDIQAMTLDARGRVVVTGPGYIKTLVDSTGAGRADHAVVFATPDTGGMGLCFDGPSLFFSGNDGLWRYEDLDGDGIADHTPEQLLSFSTGERGGHAVRKGPDGNLYLIGGNESGFGSRHITAPGSPVREIEAGALLRLTAEGRPAQAVAHGFYNPYSFDFDAAGEIFTCDGDVEADVFLPWYTPARFFHVASGGHHGWRLTGAQRSCARPDYYADTAGVLADMGRAAPTGLVCYRHRQFPALFRGGLFACDWAFGGIFFAPLTPNGASFQSQPGLFLAPLGTHGFTPTGLCVGTNGSLFVCTGGRKTRGGVFRIDYAGPPLLEPVARATINPEVNFVLQAPQPLEAWSRALWVPVARQLGAAPFQRVAVDPTTEPIWRARAIEILTELFGGLRPAQADAASAAPSPLVRGRVAWALGRYPGPNPAFTLFPLLADAHPLVRRCALEAVDGQLGALENPELVRLLLPNLGHSDRHVRQAAARVASRLSDAAWQGLSDELASADFGAQLNGLMAQMWRGANGAHPDALEPLVTILEKLKVPELRLDAVRLIILALGDWNLEKPSLELYAGCEAADVPTDKEAVLGRIRVATRALLPSGDADLDTEAARLLAMLGDNDPRAVRAVLALITPQSLAESDLHYLICFARMRSWPADLTPRVAHAVLSLDIKLHGQGTHPKLNWPIRQHELVQELARREPRLLPAFLAHPRFAAPEHLGLATQLGAALQPGIAKLYLTAVRQGTNFPWSGRLIELLSLLPPAEVRPIFRAQWKDVLLRDDLLLQLAPRPEEEDRDRFWQGLFGSLEAARASVGALRELPPDPTSTNLLAPFGLLRRLLDHPKETKFRAELLTLINALTGENFVTTEPPAPAQATLAHAAALETAYQPVLAWLAKNHPKVLAALNLNAVDDPLTWRATLKAVPWAKGEAARGERIATERGCLACHMGTSPLGPDLASAVSRLSVEELFNAIVFPSAEVAEPYRTTTFLMRDGRVVKGLVAHESDGGALVQTSADTTERLRDAEIAAQQPGRFSFMPPALLDGLKPEDLADLNSFLKSLLPQK